jgi:beta-lactamase superfamily II metal-dependent hydrolase
MSTITFFNVEHGSCALFTADTGATMMIDCGKNSSSGWTPTLELKKREISKLDLLAITNFDEDHANGLPELRKSSIKIGALWRAKNVEPDDIMELKSEDGIGAGISELVKMAKEYCHPISTRIDFGSLERKIFFNSSKDFDDENNLSGLIVLKINGRKIVFPGDLGKAGLESLMCHEEFRSWVSDTTILVAPHHGRESSVHEGFLECVSPLWTVISDCGYKYDTQRTVPIYAKYSRGGQFRDSFRKVLTTRNDGTISFRL